MSTPSTLPTYQLELRITRRDIGPGYMRGVVLAQYRDMDQAAIDYEQVVKIFQTTEPINQTWTVYGLDDDGLPESWTIDAPTRDQAWEIAHTNPHINRIFVIELPKEEDDGR